MADAPSALSERPSYATGTGRHVDGGIQRVTVPGHVGRRMAPVQLDVAVYTGTVCISTAGAQALWIDAAVLKQVVADLARDNPADFAPVGEPEQTMETRAWKTCDGCGVLYDEAYCPRCEEMGDAV